MADNASGTNKIMVYIDGTDTSITAAQYGVYLAKVMGSELHAMYVVDEKILNDLLKAKIFIKEEALDYEYDLEQDGKRYLRHVEELAKSKNIPCETTLTRGEVNAEVIQKIKELGIDLLVMNELEEATSRRDTFFDEKERILRIITRNRGLPRINSVGIRSYIALLALAENIIERYNFNNSRTDYIL